MWFLCVIAPAISTVFTSRFGYGDLFGRDDKIELALLERNEPLINLGLACYGMNKEVYKALYNFTLETPGRRG